MTLNASNAATFRLSTDDMLPRDGIALVREAAGRLYSRLEIEPIGDAPLSVTVEQQSWPSASLIFCDTNALSLVRTPQLIRDADGDFRLIARVEGARYQFAANGVDELMNGEDAALLSNSAAGRISLLGRCRCTAMRIRRDPLAAAVRGLDDRPIRRARPASQALHLLRGYVELLRRQGPATETALAHQIGNHLIDLVALALGPTEETQMRATVGATRAARLATIRADALANLSESSLSAKTIARRHGITDRYVHVLFEETGQSFNRFVEEARLRRAFVLLTEPGRAEKRIGEIASEVGFAELSTFDRAFRRRFGDTPTGVRRRRLDDLVRD
ncbi:AraC-binding-like domain-containing protein [Rhizobiales bacterium GAS191]|nr:AraC-binding-like domain-containing protein [Rhizobiales bacterium GAS191]